RRGRVRAAAGRRRPGREDSGHAKGRRSYVVHGAARALPRRGALRARDARDVRVHARVSAARVLLAACGGLLVWALFFGGGDSAGRLVWLGGATLAAAAVVAALALAG